MYIVVYNCKLSPFKKIDYMLFFNMSYKWKMGGIIVKKKCSRLAVLSMLLLLTPQKTHAFGEAVFDSEAFAHAVTQIKQQVEMLKMQALNLLPTDLINANATLQNMHNSMRSMLDLQGKIQGLPMDLKNLERTFDDTYKSATDFAGMKPSELNDHQKQLMDLTNKTTGDAMSAQALLDRNMADNNENLGRLYQANHSAKGTLAAQQAGNDIAIYNGHMMTQLQYMIAQNNQAQLAQQMQEQQRKQAEKAFNEKLWESSYTDSSREPLNDHNVGNTIDKI